MLNSHVPLQGGQGSSPVHGHDRVHVEVPCVRNEDEGWGRGAAARHHHQAHQLLRGLAERWGPSKRVVTRISSSSGACLSSVAVHDVHVPCVLCIFVSFLDAVRNNCLKFTADISTKPHLGYKAAKLSIFKDSKRSEVDNIPLWCPVLSSIVILAQFLL